MEDSEWRNSCVKCGFVKVTHGPELPETCPGCKDSRWLCHLIIPDNSQDPPTELLKNETPFPASPSKEMVAVFCHPKTSPAVSFEATSSDFLPPLTQEEGSQGIKKSGRPNRVLPVTEILALEDKGMGCKTIAEELSRHGVSDASYRTIARLLHRRRQEALL